MDELIFGALVLMLLWYRVMDSLLVSGPVPATMGNLTSLTELCVLCCVCVRMCFVSILLACGWGCSVRVIHLVCVGCRKSDTGNCRTTRGCLWWGTHWRG